MFDRSFFWDQGVLCQELPQSCYNRCCRAKKLTEGSFFLRCRPDASAALVLDVLANEDEILWCRLSVALSFVVVVMIHDADDVRRGEGRQERRAEIEERRAKWKRQTFVAVLTEVCIVVWYAPAPKNTLLLGLGAVLDLARSRLVQLVYVQ